MGKQKTRGRPSVMTAEVLQKLEHGFSCGLSDKEASLYAGICESTLYNYCQANPDFLERKELLKEQPKMKAKIILNNAIEEGSLSAAKWYLERKAKDEFSTRQEQDLSLYSPVQIINNLPPDQYED